MSRTPQPFAWLWGGVKYHVQFRDNVRSLADPPSARRSRLFRLGVSERYHNVMATVTNTLYDTDFVEWTAHTAELLRQRRFGEVDLEHVIEEIEDMGKRDFRSAQSELRRMLMHLIKHKIQPERGGTSWRGSIVSARREILDELHDSPSLRRRLSDVMGDVYRNAVRRSERDASGRSAGRFRHSLRVSVHPRSSCSRIPSTCRRF